MDAPTISTGAGPRRWRRRGRKQRRLQLPRVSRRALAALAAGLLLLVAIVLLAGGGGPSGDALARAEAYAEQGDMRAARVEAMNAVEQSPDAVAAWRLLARSQIALGDFRAALTTVERARAAGIDPGETRDLAAEAAVGMGDTGRALDETAAGDIPERLFAEAARVRGKALALDGDTGGAAQLYGESLELDPDNPRLWVDLGYFRRDTGEIAGAIEAADRAVELAPQMQAALLLKGRLARSQYGPAAGLAWFDRAVARDDIDSAARLERAATLGELGRMRSMLADARAVLERDPGNPDALYLQAVLAARAGEDDLARRLIELTEGAREAMPGMRLLTAALDLRAGNHQSAIRELEALLAQQPSNRDARRLLGAARFAAGDYRAAYWALEPLLSRPDAGTYELILAGRAEERAGEFESAYRLLERAARGGRSSAGALGSGAPDPARLAVIEGEAMSGAADEQVALIRAWLALGRTADARSLAARLAEQNPGAPQAHILHGDTLGQEGRVAAAAAAYARAANIRFTAPVALRLVEALERAGASEEAARALALFRSQNPREVTTAMLSARRNLAAGRWRAAAALLEQLRGQLGDRDAALLADLARARHELGQRDIARALARRAYRLLPMNAAVTRNYGWIAFDGGATELGIELLEKARALDPDDPLTRWQLGRAYASLGRNAAARREIEAALALPGFGDPEAAQALLERL